MLEHLSLKNLQGHKRLQIDLDRITVFTGPTNSGKSSVLRALGWVLLNRWHKCFVRHGKDTALAELGVDGRRAVRKGPKPNLYKLGKKVYKALGRGGVPPALASLFAVTEDNFQWQLDPHFWFSDSAGQVSKYLNEIVNLSAIDKSLHHTAQALNQTRNESKVVKDRLAAARERINNLEWVRAFSADLARLEALEGDLASRASGIASVALLISGWEKSRRVIDRAETRLVAARKAYRLGRLAARAAREEREIEKLVREWEGARRLSARRVPDLKPLLKLRAEADRVAEDERKADQLVEDWTYNRRERCRLEKELRAAEKKLGVCPACGRPLGGGSSRP